MIDYNVCTVDEPKVSCIFPNDLHYLYVKDIWLTADMADMADMEEKHGGKAFQSRGARIGPAAIQLKSGFPLKEGGP